jgi:hypothetical protein
VSLRLASYNVEWMNALFDDDGQLLEDRELSGRYEITRADQIAALGKVFAALDADGVMIIEAPDQSHKRSTRRALEGFAARFGLRTRSAMIGFASGTEQEIAFLYDPDVLTVIHDPRGTPGGPAEASPRFDTTLRQDLDGDGVAEAVMFSKPPLELAVTAGGRSLRLIGVHAKSKAPHGTLQPAHFRRIALLNRRKQLAECHWLRARADEHLRRGESLIVLGDFNDGPGLDKYERLFGQSGVEVMLGLDLPKTRRLYDPHAFLALNQRAGLAPATARFWRPDQACYFEALLDYIMVSVDLFAEKPVWRIWHPFNDPRIAGDPGLQAAILTASDHFPVTLDLPQVQG